MIKRPQTLSDTQLTGKKRPREQKNQPQKAAKLLPTGIPQEQLLELLERYTSFLMKKKDAGRGVFTHLESRQEDRASKIREIDNTFKNIIENQTIENWSAVLILLVRYRIALYTENTVAKSESTFGDSLWAVQEHILQTFIKAKENNVDCPVLSELVNRTLTAIDDTDEEATLKNAAFGHYSDLKKYHPGLDAITETVNTFISELNELAPADISTIYGPSSSTLWDREGRKQSCISPLRPQASQNTA